MNFQLGRRVLAAAVLYGVSFAVCAIGREDVLECGLADGSKFVLRSKYQWSAVPVPLVHASRESERKDWDPTYRDVAGKLFNVPISIMYRNKEPNVLNEICAHFGMLKKLPIIATSYLQPDGSWFSREALPWDKLSLDIGKRPDRLSPAQHSAVDKANIKRSADFAYILPKNGRLVYEQPLHRAWEGYIYTLPFDAVYQAFSDDGGKTWTDPVITTKAEIFELDKSWVEQSFRAHPVKINGKSIKADFPPSNASDK